MGEWGVGEKRLYISRYTVTTRMIPALRWAAMRTILMFQQEVMENHLDSHTAPELCGYIYIYRSIVWVHVHRLRLRNTVTVWRGTEAPINISHDQSVMVTRDRRRAWDTRGKCRSPSETIVRDLSDVYVGQTSLQCNICAAQLFPALLRFLFLSFISSL